MTRPLAALLVPQLRWDPGAGFAYLAEFVDEAIELVVGGFWLSGGPRAEAAALAAELHRRTRVPLLLAADVAEGPGSAFADATGLPPLAALAALRDRDAIRRAARLTARELRALGLNWALGPAGDLERDPANPCVGADTFGRDAQRAAEHVVEWCDTAQAEGVLTCVRRFPGLGRATADPALASAVVTADAATLWGDDLLTFRAAADAGVASIQAAGAAYPGLDRAGHAASRSRPMLTELLRGELGFEGLVVSEALDAPGLRQGGDEATAAIAALAAGCDLLLAPYDLHGVLEAVEAAADGGLLAPAELAASRRRRDFWAGWAAPGAGREPTLEDVLWARQCADTLVHPVRGVLANIGPVVDVIQVEDGAAGAPAVPARDALVRALAALGLKPRSVAGPTAEGEGAVLLALHGGPRAGAGRAGYDEGTQRRVAQVIAEARLARRSVVVALFGPPRLAAAIPEATNVVCAWSGSRAMQESLARRLA